LKVNYEFADMKALFRIIINPFLFLNTKKKVNEIAFEPLNPTYILYYSNIRSIEKLGFYPGKDSYVWRSWKNNAHYIGVCIGFSLLRKNLFQNILHEIGHIVCYETNHQSHQINTKKLTQIYKSIKEKDSIYRQKLEETIISNPKLRQIEQMFEVISIENLMKDFFANDVMIKYCNPEERLKFLIEEAEDICHKLIESLRVLSIIYSHPFFVLNSILISLISESSALRLSKKNLNLQKEFNEFKDKLDKLYTVLPKEANTLRNKLTTFLSNVSEKPNSIDVINYISTISDYIINFYESYSW